MTIYEGYLEIPMLYTEEGTITWEWFNRNCNTNREIQVENGYVVLNKSLQNYYISAFSAYIEFEYYDDHILYDQLMDIVGIISSFVDTYDIDQYICISSSI